MTTRRDVIAQFAALSTLAVMEPFSMVRAGSVKLRPSAKAAGFRVPLESDAHELTFMQWPARSDIYGGRQGLKAVRSAIANIAKTVARFEPVIILVRPEQSDAAGKVLGEAIGIWQIPTDDLWCRDSGPLFVVADDGRLGVSDLSFNGWGNKQEHGNDGRIAQRIAEKLKVPIFANGIVGEAGGVEVDGAGTALAHESSWINPNRNAHSKAETQRLLLDALGAQHIIWAPGIKGADITDYHIDALARFVKPGQIVMQLGKSPDRGDPWSVAAFETYKVLKSARDANGRLLEIAIIPEPINVRSRAKNFVASYVNYYVCNGAVIGAEFGDDKADANAQVILQQLYPGREVISLNVDVIGGAGGGIHCTTQQKPVMGA